MHPFVNTAIKATRSAANIITRAFVRPDLIRVSAKGHRDFVTNTDKAAEQTIIYILQTAYPTHSILAEESGASSKQDDYQWIIDPIDGTLNFMHGFPHFSISIALKYKNRLEHGVIYDPVRDDLFVASRGAGAQKNNHRIRVGQHTHLPDCLIGTGFPAKAMQYHENYHAVLQALSKECAVRRTGSAALDLAYVAAGHLDGFWELKLAPWDMAAGILMIKEAGGLVCDIKGEENYLKNGSIVCGNAKITKQLLKIIQPCFKNSNL
jgi:myo-inositol-1(or 4)-monophosphatase